MLECNTAKIALLKSLKKRKKQFLANWMLLMYSNMNERKNNIHQINLIYVYIDIIYYILFMNISDYM